MNIFKKEAYEAPEIMVLKVETEGILANSNKREGYNYPYEC